MPGDLKSQMGACPESDQAEALSGLKSCAPERAITDDAGAKQRGCVKIVETIRKREDKRRVGYRPFGETAIRVESREVRVRAQVLLAAVAGVAVAAGPAQPGDSHPAPDRGSRHAFAEPLDLAHYLVPGDARVRRRNDLTFGQMEIRVADAAGANTHEDLARARRGRRPLFEAERLLLDGPRLMQNYSPHEPPSEQSAATPAVIARSRSLRASSEPALPKDIGTM
jgi:hypothetical protein